MVTGLRPETFKRLQLNAGIFLKNFDYSAIADAAALAAAVRTARTEGTSLLGATRGGGTFECTPEVRNIEADGKRYEFVGSTIFDSWTVRMTGTLLEVSAENLTTMLASADIDEENSTETKKLIKVRTDLADSDYIDNLVWIGDTSVGFLLIDLHNALNITGASLTFTDKGEGTLPFEFHAHQDDVEATEHAPVDIVMFGNAA